MQRRGTLTKLLKKSFVRVFVFICGSETDQSNTRSVAYGEIGIKKQQNIYLPPRGLYLSVAGESELPTLRDTTAERQYYIENNKV